MPRACLIVCLVLLGAAPAAACEAPTRLGYNAPVELEGTLKEDKGQHDAQGEFTYAYLALDTPVCVDAPPEGDEFNASTEAPIGRIQMAGEANTKDLPIGKHVVVKGTLFGAHTMWHVEPVLIDAEAVEPK